jgi:cytochrome c551/c552
MRGLPAILLLLLLVVAVGVCSTRSLPLGDARRGRALFSSLDCLTCHSIRGEGGNLAPDLGKRVTRAYSPAELAGLMWNHGPAMWAAFARRGLTRPEPTEQQVADLFTYFFSAGYFDNPGDPRRGGEVFRSRGCAGCHGIDKPLHPLAKPVTAWRCLDDPVALAREMWNHYGEMSSALAVRRIPYPRLAARDLADLLAHLRSLPQLRGRQASLAPASADSGQALYQAKGCAGCHRGALALEDRPTRYSLTEFAAAMWNHPARTPGALGPLTQEEMSGVVGYLFSRQFFEERGEIERGRRVYAQKKCGACHDQALSGAPPASRMAGRMTSYAMVAALWRHGPAMEARMRQLRIPWPRFDGPEMADLTAYLHGLEFKRRPVSGSRPFPGGPPMVDRADH